MSWSRWTRRAMVMLLLGAAVNVGVAWWCAAVTMDDLVPGNRPTLSRRQSSEELRWPVSVPAGWPPPLEHADTHYRFGYVMRTWSHLWLFRNHPGVSAPGEDEPLLCVVYQSRCGWPLASCGAWRVMDQHFPKHELDQGWTLGMMTMPDWSRRVVSWLRSERVALWDVPTIPLWRGFAVNTALYALVVLGVHQGLLVARGRLRRLRHLCPRCAYDVGNLARCPECGEIVERGKWRAMRGKGGGA